MTRHFFQKDTVTSYPRYLIPLLILFASARASNLTVADVCPPSSIYTPFKKWPSDLLLVNGPTENSACWWWAECVIDQSPEVRKSQFAATSFVMGLVPLILKDIAWPDRRQVFVPSPLNIVIEAIVRALGLIPVVKDDAKPIYLPYKFSKRKSGMATLVLLTLSLLVAYAALVVIEFFSKRSSLGCPYPLFICTWFIIALIPAGVRTYISGFYHSDMSCRSFVTEHILGTRNLDIAS